MTCLGWTEKRGVERVKMNKQYGRFHMYGFQIMYYIISSLMFLAGLCLEIGVLLVATDARVWGVTCLIIWALWLIDYIVGWIIKDRVLDLRTKEIEEARAKWKQESWKFK